MQTNQLSFLLKNTHQTFTQFLLTHSFNYVKLNGKINIFITTSRGTFHVR